MAQKYLTVFTPIGKELALAAYQGGETINLAYIGIGDGFGSEYTPVFGQETLRNEVAEVPVSSVLVSKTDPFQIVTEGYLLEGAGGFWIRELCVKDEKRRVIAVSSWPQAYKPTLAEGGSAAYIMRFALQVLDTTIFELKIDTSVAMVSKDQFIKHIEQTQSVHGSSVEALPNSLVQRDEGGRAQFEAPLDEKDAARLKDLQELEDRVDASKNLKELEDRLNARINEVENLGDALGSVATKAALPTNTSQFSKRVTVNDFITVQKDETQSNAATRYVITDISSSGVITWKHDFTFSTDISGKQDKITATGTTNLLTAPNVAGEQPGAKAISDLMASPAAQTANTQLLVAPNTKGATPGLKAISDFIASPAAATTADAYVLVAPTTKGAAPGLKLISDIKPNDATTTLKGIVQLATEAEVLDGTNDTKAVTPKSLHRWISYVESIIPDPNTLVDSRDGKKYKTVLIGGKRWMAANLNYEGKGVWYNNDVAMGNKYGRLYTWADARIIAPAGWHLPSDEEWNALCQAVGGTGSPNYLSGAATKLKATSGWNNNGNGTDDFGFSALPGGYSDGSSFDNVGDYGFWWSATEYDTNYAWNRYMDSGYASVGRYNNVKSYLHSVRCVQD